MAWGEGRVHYVFSCNVEGQGMYMILGMWCGRIVTPKSTPKSARCSHGVYFSAEHTLLFGKTYLAFRPHILCFSAADILGTDMVVFHWFLSTSRLSGSTYFAFRQNILSFSAAGALLNQALNY